MMIYGEIFNKILIFIQYLYLYSLQNFVMGLKSPKISRPITQKIEKKIKFSDKYYKYI
jgi:hypothetical protein